MSGRRPEHIRFVFTPPYTPGVSPIERVFEDVKDKVTADVHQSLDELSEVLVQIVKYVDNQWHDRASP